MLDFTEIYLSMENIQTLPPKNATLISTFLWWLWTRVSDPRWCLMTMHHKDHLTILFPKRMATFHGAFLLILSVGGGNHDHYTTNATAINCSVISWQFFISVGLIRRVCVSYHHPTYDFIQKVFVPSGPYSHIVVYMALLYT